MEIAQLRDWTEAEFTYPLTADEVVSQAGDQEIAAPEPEESETIESVINRCGETTFEEPVSLFEAIIGNLGEAYVGRKFYDDRGCNPVPDDRSQANATL